MAIIIVIVIIVIIIIIIIITQSILFSTDKHIVLSPCRTTAWQ